MLDWNSPVPDKRVRSRMIYMKGAREGEFNTTTDEGYKTAKDEGKKNADASK
jgi:hypothetical protein